MSKKKKRKKNKEKRNEMKRNHFQTFPLLEFDLLYNTKYQILNLSFVVFHQGLQDL